MRGETLLDDWTAHCKNFFAGEPTIAHPIHPCVINNRPHYVHAPELARRDPDYYQRLKQFTDRHGIGLKPDQRQTGAGRHNCRRKKFVPIIFLAMGLLSFPALAEHVDQQLGLMAVSGVTSDYDSDIQAAPSGRIEKWERSIVSEAIEQILLAHLDTKVDQEPDIRHDITELSIYYARFPAVVKLLTSIARADWTLRYAPHMFQTNVSGSRLEVERVEVFFDPRSGARLKFYDKCKTQKPFCIASPADALLHELLHVEMITQDTATFIQQGGLNPMSYPVEHERLIISRENHLYATMTAVDGQARPIRNEHNGRHVLVSCATCLE